MNEQVEKYCARRLMTVLERLLEDIRFFSVEKKSEVFDIDHTFVNNIVVT